MFVDRDQKEANAPHSREQESPSITKLSQAIREGAKLRPQCYGSPFYGDRTCAWGAAMEALGGVPNHDTPRAIRFVGERLYGNSHWAWTQRDGNEVLADRVWLMNDQLKMTREQIADWLESQGY